MLFDWIMNRQFLPCLNHPWDPSVKSHRIDALVMRPSLKLASSWFLQFQRKNKALTSWRRRAKQLVTCPDLRSNETQWDQSPKPTDVMMMWSESCWLCWVYTLLFLLFTAYLQMLSGQAKHSSTESRRWDIEYYVVRYRIIYVYVRIALMYNTHTPIHICKYIYIYIYISWFHGMFNIIQHFYW